MVLKKKAAPKKVTPKKAAPKKAAPKKIIPKKKATPKKAAPKKVIPKKASPKKKITLTKKVTPKKETGKRLKAIGFQIDQKSQTSIEKSYENIQNVFDKTGSLLNEFIYEGKRKNAISTRSGLMDLIKETKNLRNLVQEAKINMKPIYKE